MEDYSVRGCRVMGCRDGVNGVEGHSVGECGVGGYCEGRVYGNDLMEKDYGAEGGIFWKCVTRKCDTRNRGVGLWGCRCNGSGGEGWGLLWDKRTETGLRGRWRDH